MTCSSTPLVSAVFSTPLLMLPEIPRLNVGFWDHLKQSNFAPRDIQQGPETSSTVTLKEGKMLPVSSGSGPEMLLNIP